jgi:hypothetical protein
MKRLSLPLLCFALALPAHAQNTAPDTFADDKDGAKVHVASGFVCPQKIGLFERDAVGESDIDTGSDFCAYSALDGVYGTVTITRLAGAYDPLSSLALDFTEQEGTGGKKIAEADVKLGQPPLAVYTRTYQTSTLEDLRYRVLFTGAAMNGWAVETTIEYADPRDTPVEREFLDAIYAAAKSDIAAK